jgi:hypothetical protein
MIAPKMSSPTELRQIVSRTLQASLNPAQMAAVLDVLDREFLDQANFALTDFVNRIDQLVDLGDRKNGMRALLARNLNLVHGAADGGSPAAAAPRPAVIVFDAVVNAIHKAVDLADPAKAEVMCAAMAKGLGAANLGPPFKAELQAWCQDRIAKFTNGGSDKDLATVVHALYVWCCNALGPTATDKLFANAMREAERLPEAAQFPPRRLC